MLERLGLTHHVRVEEEAHELVILKLDSTMGRPDVMWLCVGLLGCFRLDLCLMNNALDRCDVRF
jgi:hypothetical protein